MLALRVRATSTSTSQNITDRRLERLMVVELMNVTDPSAVARWRRGARMAGAATDHMNMMSKPSRCPRRANAGQRAARLVS